MFYGGGQSKKNKGLSKTVVLSSDDEGDEAHVVHDVQMNGDGGADKTTSAGEQEVEKQGESCWWR